MHPFPGTSIWETAEFWLHFFLLLTCQVLCQGHAWPGLSLQTGHWEWDHACQSPSLLGNLSHLPFWTLFTCLSNAFFLCSVLLCVIWTLLKEAFKESPDRSTIHSPEGEAGRCGQLKTQILSGDSSYASSSALAALMTATRKERNPHGQDISVHRLLLIESHSERQGRFIREISATIPIRFPS